HPGAGAARRRHDEEEPREPVRVSGATMSDTTGHTFSAAELATFAAVLDEIIPPSAERRLPGGGFLAGSDRVAHVVGLMPGLDLALASGLAAVEEGARSRGAAAFTALPSADRVAVVNEVAAKDGGFVPMLMFVAFTTYYVDDRILAALDLEPRPPHP